MKHRMTSEEAVSFYSSLFRELLTAAVESDESVKHNFRGLPASTQDKVKAEIDRKSRELAQSFHEYLTQVRVDPSHAPYQELQRLVRKFLADSLALHSRESDEA